MIAAIRSMGYNYDWFVSYMYSAYYIFITIKPYQFIFQMYFKYA